MGNIILFLNAFLSYVLLFVFIVVLVIIACVIGAKWRKSKDLKSGQLAEAEGSALKQ